MGKFQIQPSITSRDSETLKRLFNEIRRIPLLTMEEEADLARRSRAGDVEARKKLVRANLRFVVSIAKKYTGMGVALEDLISEGCIALIKSAEKFDESKGVKFISYAVVGVCRSLSEAVSEYGRIMRLPQNKYQGIGEVNKAINRLEQKLCRMPTMEEIADELELPDEVVAQLLQLSGRAVSLDVPLAPDSETTLEEILVTDYYEPADKSLMRQDQEKVVAKALSLLPETERRVIEMSFGIGADRELTTNEIGEKLNISRERVRQLKDRACKRLRTNDEYEFLRQHFAA